MAVDFSSFVLPMLKAMLLRERVFSPSFCANFQGKRGGEKFLPENVAVDKRGSSATCFYETARQNPFRGDILVWRQG
jgi:hypothetical protein